MPCGDIRTPARVTIASIARWASNARCGCATCPSLTAPCHLSVRDTRKKARDEERLKGQKEAAEREAAEAAARAEAEATAAASAAEAKKARQAERKAMQKERSRLRSLIGGVGV